MSAAVQSYITSLFGVEDQSDCTIVFYCEQRERSSDAVRQSRLALLAKEAGDYALGDPLPAHLFVLRGGSQRFRAQADRWSQRAGPGGKPLLRVPLDSSDDLPDALAAVRFMYSGRLDASGAAALLRLRRMAAYLQVEGCMQACDEALKAHILSNTAGAAQQQPPGGPLAGVLGVYACRQVLWEVCEEASAIAVLRTCQRQLVKHSAAPLPEGSVSLGELLAWAFGDAPSVLSDRETRKLMEALPPPAMEALMGSESFATDSEASVLSMLARWLRVNRQTPDAVRQRLFKLVRLCQLSSAYLHVLVPAIPWLSSNMPEIRFLCQQLSASSAAERTCIATAAASMFDTKSAWYDLVARPMPQSGVPRSYEWAISEAALRAALAKLDDEEEQQVCLTGAVSDDGLVVANGLVWDVSLVYERGQSTAGVFLSCRLPSSLRIATDVKLPFVASPGAVRVAVYQWRHDGSREEAWCCEYGPETYVPSWGRLGHAEALPLVDLPQDVMVCVPGGPGQGQQATEGEGSVSGGCTGVAEASLDPLAAWAPYLHDGKMSGAISWQ